MRHTKVMATVSGERCTPEAIKELARTGADGFRINSAHVGPDEIARMIDIIRTAAPHAKILMDTKGPEIRINAPAVPFRLTVGDTVRLLTSDAPSSASQLCLMTSLDGSRLLPGNTVLVDDGAAELSVTELLADGSFLLTVTRGAGIDAAKTLASPDGMLPDLPPVSERDRINIIAALKAGIDIIAHSFVRSAADVKAVRELLNGHSVQLYAKIECRRAVENLESIGREADALLVARGDLGTQMPLCELPAIQMRIARFCRLEGKPMMIATQILESMTHSPLPTRAELNDIAMGVMQGAAWLLLCGETARGSYPVSCVDIMSRTIAATENANPCLTIC